MREKTRNTSPPCYCSRSKLEGIECSPKGQVGPKPTSCGARVGLTPPPLEVGPSSGTRATAPCSIRFGSGGVEGLFWSEPGWSPCPPLPFVHCPHPRRWGPKWHFFCEVFCKTAMWVNKRRRKKEVQESTPKQWPKSSGVQNLRLGIGVLLKNRGG